jgi:hypothetical protein
LALAEDLIKEGLILVGLHRLIETEGEVGVELDFEGGFELVDDFGEEGREVVGEGIFGGRWISIEPLLQVLNYFLFELGGQRLHLLRLFFIEA